MKSRAIASPFLSIGAAALLALSISACSMGSGLSLTTLKTRGYALSDDAMAQIRPGQSMDLVIVVLGSPQTTNNFGDQTAWYYVETKVEETALGINTIKERTVLAIYFDKNKRVTDKAVYSAKDGKIVPFESRRTPSFGADRTFIESILSSF